MKFPSKLKLKKIVGDATRPMISEPFLDIVDGKGKLVATNGHVMAVVPVEVTEQDTKGYVPSAALETAVKLVGKHGDGEITANGGLVFPNGGTSPRPELGTFPNYHQVLIRPTRKDVALSFNAPLLMKLVESLGGTGVVTLHVELNADGTQQSGTAFRVEVQGAPYGTEAVLMPFRIGK